MKKFTYYALALIAIVSITITAVTTEKASVANATATYLVVSTNNNLASTSRLQGSSELATTTTTGATSFNWMTAGTATTTLQLYTANVDHVGLNIMFNASSTSSVLKWRYEYSTDGIKWYGAATPVTTSASTTYMVANGAEYAINFVASANASNTPTFGFYRTDIPALASPYLRIVFYLPAGSAGGGVAAQAILKNTNIN